MLQRAISVVLVYAFWAARALRTGNSLSRQGRLAGARRHAPRDRERWEFVVTSLPGRPHSSLTQASLSLVPLLLLGLPLFVSLGVPIVTAPTEHHVAATDADLFAGSTSPLMQVEGRNGEPLPGRGGPRNTEIAFLADDSQPSSTDEQTQPADVASTELPSETVRASAAPERPTAYTIREGDFVNQIAARFSLKPQSIVWANGLASPDYIVPGQRLTIPAEDLAQPPASPTTPAFSSPASPPVASSSRAGSNREEAFIASLIDGAQQSQRLTRVPASVTIAQGILETFWGTSFLAREANNYFGIKAHSKPGPAGIVWIDAWEVEDGEVVNRPEPFRKYNTVAESLVDHGRFFVENRRYGYALQAGDDPREFARRINDAGYATDPRYAGKLISLMDRYNLYQYDLPL